MMDFLRRLAPARATDAARAFALLPSRFASENPLQATLAQARRAQPHDDEEASPSPGAASPAATASTRAPPPHPVTSVPPPPAMPPPLTSQPPRSDNKNATSPPLEPASKKATSSAGAPAEAPATHVVHPRVIQDRQREYLERTGPASTAPQVLAAAPAAGPGLHVIAAPPAQARAALPLSQAVVAQRALQSRADRQEVHVTIGRIDVVANTAPAPAVRHSPAPRPGTVTLADYLRGSKAGHQ